MQEKAKTTSKRPIRTAPDNLYEADFFAWTQSQARLLRERRWCDLDLENLAEEMETLGRSDKRQIESRLVVILVHLLKWKYQPGVRSPGWRRTLREQRRRIAGLVEESPSLRAYPAQIFLEQYLQGRLDAADETGIAFELFPEECPFTMDQALDPDFLPEEPGHIGAGKPTTPTGPGSGG